MFVFVEMNRDAVLSHLNGTNPGKLNWDRDFISRIVVYGVLPISALLGAQFPQSLAQLLSHFLPGGGVHP